MTAAIIDLDAARLNGSRGRSLPPEWGEDIENCCAYAELLKAEHGHEQARIRFELLHDHGGYAWYDASNDIRSRVDANNLLWDACVALLVHVAGLPTQSRSEASRKRSTIGKLWLQPEDGSCPFTKMRAGCVADDHLFPPSLKLVKVKGKVRV